MISNLENTPTLALLDGRYQLHERVGEGGMAQVYRAEDVILGRTVAIKMMRTDADVLAASARAHSEVKALATLNHPSLVTLLDARIEPGRARYLVMEFVQGPTLAERLRNAPLSLREVAHLAGELADGLGAVHDAGLLHRDVKPSNVLLAPASGDRVGFHVKLTDFGLAQYADADPITTPGIVLGTAAYLSPEQVRGQGSSPASDIYALGLVLLEALTGDRPFSHTSGIGAVLARLLESPAIPEDLPGEWVRLLESMTASDPALRPTALEVARRVAVIPVEPARAAVVPPAREITIPVGLARMRAGSHVAPPRRQARAARREGAWLRRAVMASSAVVAALAVVFGTVLIEGASPVGTGIARLPQGVPNHSPFALVREEPLTVTDPDDTANIGVVEVPMDPIAYEAPANSSPADGDEQDAGQEVTKSRWGHAPPDVAKEMVADQRAVDKQAATEQREAAKRAAAEEREADKAAREAERAADKATREAERSADAAERERERAD